MTRPKTVALITVSLLFIWIIFSPPKWLAGSKVSLFVILKNPLKSIDLASDALGNLSRIIPRPAPDLASEGKITIMRKELDELREAALENGRLTGLLKFGRTMTGRSIPARVIGRDPDDWSSVVFIDKGLSDGVKTDMIVLSSLGLAGRIREAGSGASKVMLINDADSRVGALIQRTREQGLLVGTVDGKCKLIYLSMDADVREGDVVMTSAMGGLYPKGLLIGRVFSVDKERGKLYKSAIVRPDSALSALEEVLCIK